MLAAPVTNTESSPALQVCDFGQLTWGTYTATPTPLGAIMPHWDSAADGYFAQVGARLRGV